MRPRAANEVPPAQYRPNIIPGDNRPQVKDLVVQIKLADLEPFQRLTKIMSEFVFDERVPNEVRKEYVDRIIHQVG